MARLGRGRRIKPQYHHGSPLSAPPPDVPRSRPTVVLRERISRLRRFRPKPFFHQGSPLSAPPAAPTVDSFAPTSGVVGTPVTITGTNFTGATSCKFNGVEAVGFTVNTPTQISATVPAGAITGPISVTTAGGTGTSATNFTVTVAIPIALVPRPITPRLLPVLWSIDENPVSIEGWDATAKVNVGFDQMRGRITAASAKALASIGQGSIVKGVLANGFVQWEGRLAAAPVIGNDRTAQITAQGYNVAAAKRTDPLLYETVSVAGWSDGAAAPFSQTGAIGPNYAASVLASGLSFTAPFQSVGLEYPLCFWRPGNLISRYAFTISVPTGTVANFFIRCRTTSGNPASGRTFVADHAVTDGAVIDRVLVGSEQGELLQLSLYCSAGTSASDLTVILNGVKVWGATALTQFFASDVVANVAGRLGWDAGGRTSSPTGVLPLDWSGAWSDLLSYIAALDDYYWLVIENAGAGPRVVYGPYGGVNSWALSSERGAKWDLTPLEVFNRVTVGYTDTAGTAKTLQVMADPDPLASLGLINDYRFDVQDPQPDTALITALAYRLVGTLSRPRWRGRINAVSAYDANGRDAVQEIQPGDLVTITNWDAGTALPLLRVLEVSYRPDGPIALGIDAPVSIASLLRDFAPALRPF